MGVEKAMMAAEIKVLIADDHAGMRAGLRQLLRAAGDIVVIAEAEDGVRTVELAESSHPDVILLDVEMPLMRGDQAMQLINRAHPEIRVLAVSAYDDQSYIHSMLENGAAGYITKDEVPLLLLNAIHAIVANTAINWLSPRARKSGGILSSTQDA